MIRHFPILISLLITWPSAHAQLCKKWAPAIRLGQLDRQAVNEASGMAISKTYNDRVYWINDSGDNGHLYYTNLKGENASTIKLKKFKTKDSEALALGPCPDGTCVFVGDIGDNKAERPNIKIAIIPEVESFPNELKPKRVIELSYPDGAHDAESMVVLPDGRLMIFSKNLQLFTLAAGESSVYVLNKEELWADGDTKTLKKAGTLPIPAWTWGELFVNQVATDASIDLERSVLGILTYKNAIEIPLDHLDKLDQVANWQNGVDFAVVGLPALAQQETLGYAGKQLYWATEYHTPEAPFFSMKCEN